MARVSGEQAKFDILNKSRSSIFPWRGQFSPQLIEFLIEKYGPQVGLVADPFCGSGTVLYEAATHHLDVFACDINPAAVCLARVSSVCAKNTEERAAILKEVVQLSRLLLDAAENNGGMISALTASEILQKIISFVLAPEVLVAFLLLVYGNNNMLKLKSISRITNLFLKSIMLIPYYSGVLSVDIGDARQLNIHTDSVDYIVTSPPYINVFNYHQNYRPLIEALGFEPLSMARAELGANRKFRQNRYFTAIQYCMDMAQFFVEAARVLKPGKRMTIILGRESNIRGVPLKNGELIAAIGSDGLGGTIIDWRERHFVNRFGQTIYEDILTIVPVEVGVVDAVEVGRSVGVEALRRALVYCPHNRVTEIELAIAAAAKIVCSPFVLEEK